MPDNKTLLGALTIIIGVVSYSLYFRGIFRGNKRPDGFSWLIWGTLAMISFFAQASRGGGAGTWVTALTAVMCLAIATTAFLRNGIYMKFIDGISLLGAGLGLVLWHYTNDPLFAIVLMLIVGAIGFVPVFQKAFEESNDETATTYLLNALKFAVAFFAIQSLNLVTVLYPTGMVFMNISLVGALFLRRKSPAG